MARKKKGYVELFWECPNCRGENLGSNSICGNCGKTQPENVEFYQGSHQEILKDEAKIKRAAAGADIHCGYCNTRNAGNAKTCSQCGASLSEGAQRKSSGRVVGSFTAGKGNLIKCPNCGTSNAYVNRKCHNCGVPLSHKQKSIEKKEKSGPKGNVLVMIAIGLFLACSIFYFVFLRTSDVTGVVTGGEWNRSIEVEEFAAVEREDWLDEIPSDVDILSCSEEVRSVQTEAPLSGRYDEVCGTPYNVETGTGFAEVVQDCEYQIYEDMCSYETMDWTSVGTIEEQGSNLSAFWPSTSLTSEQRLGERSESYSCIFEADGDSYSYSVDSYSEFQDCAIGSQWILNVNALGGVTSIER